MTPGCYNVLVFLCVLAVLGAALNEAHSQGIHKGREQGYVKGWAQGHEKRLMQDMERICL